MDSDILEFNDDNVLINQDNTDNLDATDLSFDDEYSVIEDDDNADSRN